VSSVASTALGRGFLLAFTALPPGRQSPAVVVGCEAPAETAAPDPARGPAPGDAEARNLIKVIAAKVNEARKGRRLDSLSVALAREATLYNYLGKPDTAGPLAREALVAARNQPGSQQEVQALAVLGETLQYQGRSDSALPLYQAALALVQLPERARQRGRICNDIGIAHHELGDIELALGYLTRARAIRAAVGDTAGVGATLNNLGRVHSTVGRPALGLKYLDSARTITRSLGDASGEATALNNMGYTYDLMAQPARALEMYNAALTALSQTHRMYYRGLTLINIGRAYLALGRAADARSYLQEGMAAKQAAGDAAGVSWAYHDLGRALLRLGDKNAGIGYLERARTDMRRRGDPVREGSALYYLGAAYQAAGDSASLRRAVAYYDTAAAVRLSVRQRAGNDEDRVVFAEQDRNLTAQWALAWLTLAQWTRSDIAQKASLVVAERGRARALLDLLRATASEARGVPGTAPAAPRPGADPLSEAGTLLQPLRTSGTPALSYLVTRDALLGWLALPSGDVRVHCQRAPRAWLDSLVSGLRGLIYAAGPGGAAADSGSTMLTDVSTPLPATCTAVPGPAAAIVQQGLRPVLAALSQIIIPPEFRSALASSGELIIVPNGVLGVVPFAALPADAAGTPLGVLHALRYSPSIAFLDQIDTVPMPGSPPRLRGAVIVGDPTMPLDPETGAPFPALPSAGRTARWLGDRLGAPVLTGPTATKSAVLKSVRGATLIHFGTHGRAFGSEGLARQSFVVLAADRADDGLLTVADVVDSLRLAADLVVLSACETGLGNIKETEGTLGLQRAFLARGARSVLVSLWRVDTAATDALVKEFYEEWLGEPRRTKAEALQGAQKKLWKEWARGREGDEPLNPYWWAGFQLVGGR
jgi:tetratricopeptide (TPR) repeat protein